MRLFATRPASLLLVLHIVLIGIVTWAVVMTIPTTSLPV
jgi:hypothetical protein